MGEWKACPEGFPYAFPGPVQGRFRKHGQGIRLQSCGEDGLWKALCEPAVDVMRDAFMVPGQAPNRVKLIACEVLARECHAVVARAKRPIDLELLQQGLHDLGPDGMRERLQEAIDATEGYDEILLGYGLCSNGIVGLKARAATLVVPRAHDCISLFLGSAKRYQDEFEREPGTYYFSGGWLERDKDMKHPPGSTVNERLGIGKSFAEYAAEYGEENARYLVKTLGEGLTHYTRIVFIQMGLGPEGAFEEAARQRAEAEALRFEKLVGDLGLLQRLVDGDTSGDEVLIVPSGGTIRPDHTGRIIRT